MNFEKPYSGGIAGVKLGETGPGGRFVALTVQTGRNYSRSHKEQMFSKRTESFLFHRIEPATIFTLGGRDSVVKGFE
jgi:hypothetical protein